MSIVASCSGSIAPVSLNIYSQRAVCCVVLSCHQGRWRRCWRGAVPTQRQAVAPLTEARCQGHSGGGAANCCVAETNDSALWTNRRRAIGSRISSSLLLIVSRRCRASRGRASVTDCDNDKGPTGIVREIILSIVVVNNIHPAFTPYLLQPGGLVVQYMLLRGPIVTSNV